MHPSYLGSWHYIVLDNQHSSVTSFCAEQETSGTERLVEATTASDI